MSTPDIAAAINARLAPVWAELERAENDREAEAAKANPGAHKLSRVFEGRGGTNYRYYSRKDGRGRTVRFCWSSHRNVAGYFLGWREVVTTKQIKRDRWLARRSRKAVAAVAKRRSQAQGTIEKDSSL